MSMFRTSNKIRSRNSNPEKLHKRKMLIHTYEAGGNQEHGG